ncbi:MAG: ThuA domain-containing protein [Verrucomicrobia bacterium]|nr:MAG: ThuA domain-containing protein [Verrucomicrobiota bacterium]
MKPRSRHLLRFSTTAALIALMLLTGCATSSAQAKSPKRVLVVTTTTGFRHSSIPLAESILQGLASESGAFTVEYARVEPKDEQFKGADGKPDKAKVNEAIKAVLAEKMNRTALAKYDAVIFASTTGDLPLPEREALLDFIKSGKGFVGVHAATDTFPGFPGYIEMIGGEFLRHGPQVEVTAINQDRDCPACKHLGATWTVFDEIYQLKNFDRAKVHGLLTLDRLMLNADDIKNNKATPGDYPVAWMKNYGKGRVFYTSLGHREDIWDPAWKDAKGERKNAPAIAEAFQKHLLGGIKWALGLEAGDATPQTAATK